MCLIFTFQRYHESAPLPGWVVFLISWLGTTAFSRSGLSPHRHASQASNATALPKVCWLHPHFAVHASDLLLQSPAVFSGESFNPSSEGQCRVPEVSTWHCTVAGQFSKLVLKNVTAETCLSPKWGRAVTPSHHRGPTEMGWSACLNAGDSKEQGRIGARGWGSDGHHRGKPGDWEREYS